MQRYLLGVSHSDKAQMNLLSVEHFIEITMHYATDYALFSCTAIETMDNNELAWRLTYDYMVKFWIQWLQRTLDITYYFLRSLEICLTKFYCSTLHSNLSIKPDMGANLDPTAN